ncbi:VWA domain-containing protein [Marimonas sp. MJW-29]|uniref:VWA domain-containing protein n=1 Tax=Sulfitobacter sediminis TaxID=3234186 RepID=A0ABV3RI75_9RHOB
MRLFATSALIASLATAAFAQQQSNTILVLDGSGSMWGQIDGTAKIGIAQEVVSGLLADFPADQGLGLTVYGHRERGNCTDIETIVAPAPGTAAAIETAVRGIKPLGKTPMTDAVIAAAEALRYTEEAATVILVSDGVETCNPDPCAAARLLEEAGIDFTAHVIGFDVSDPEALAQMQCLADETGGQFLTAANADELNLAMTAVVQTPPPEPEPILIEMTFTAVMGDAKATIDTPVLWSISGNDGPIVQDAPGNPLLYEMQEGAYTATAYSVADETSAEAGFIAIEGGATTVEVVFEERLPSATIAAPATASAGATIEVGWKGPAEENDFVAIRSPDAEGYHRFANQTRVGDTATVDLLMPNVPGDYVIEYILNRDRIPLAEAAITVIPVEAALVAPATAPAGATIDVGWKGPAYANDFIAVRSPDADGYHRFINSTGVSKGNPVKLEMPSEPGTYVIEYIENQGRSPLAAAEITVAAVSATIIAPAEAPAGATIDVGWKGPDYANDFIAVRSPDAEGYHRFINTVATKRGNPAKLAMPTDPGTYLIEYIENQDRTPMAVVEITITAVEASLIAPATAAAGATIDVGWKGPDYPNDFLAVRSPEAEGYHRFIDTVATKRGNPGKLEMPAEPGTYLIEYIENQDRSPLAVHQITLSPVTASLIVPPSAAAGAQIDVGWKGPGYPNDFVAIRKPEAEGYHRFSATKGLKGGPTVKLKVPDKPGSYVVEYIIGQSRAPLAAQTIEVTSP